MRLSAPQFRKVVEKVYAKDEEDMRGPKRTHRRTRAQQIGYYYHRDYTTALYVCGAIARRMAEEAMLLEEISTMRAVLNGAPPGERNLPRDGSTLTNSAVMCTAPAKLTPYRSNAPGGVDPEVPDFLRRSKCA